MAFRRPNPLDLLIVVGVVIATALFGIFSRPVGFLALVWPANAILLGMMVRQPRLASVWCWLVATITFVAVDLATGKDLVPALGLAGANIAGVFAGWVAFQFLGEQHRRLSQPLSILYMLIAVTIASVASALVGCWMAPSLLGRDLLSGFVFWFVSELVNYVVVLPAALTFPGLAAFRNRRAGDRPQFSLLDLAPAMALVVSVVLADLIGGPGTIAVPAPALLWCAIRYPFFATAALTLAVCLWQMVVFVDIVGVQDEGQDAVYAAMSIRLGLALLALGPLTVSSVIQAHNALVRRLGQVISHDSLTGALSRTGFLDQGRQLACARSDVCVIMFDLDDFKHVNDRLGHAVGDIALVGFAGVASSQLRSGDILGRVGGEEFAAILCGVEMATAMQIAERIRAETERLVIDVEGKEPLRITVSAGLAMGGPDLPLERLMIAADAALYEAKRAGRNRVAISSGRDEPAAAIGAKRNAA